MKSQNSTSDRGAISIGIGSLAFILVWFAAGNLQAQELKLNNEASLGFRILNSQPGYEYLVLVNREPLLWSKNEGIETFSGYLFREGENDLVVSINKRGVKSDEYSCRMDISMQESDSQRWIDRINCLATNNVECRKEYKVKVTKKPLNTIRWIIEDKETNVEFGKQFVLKYVSALATINDKEFENLLGNGAKIKRSDMVPSWVSESKTSQIEIASISSEKDIAVWKGKYFWLFYPKNPNLGSSHYGLVSFKKKDKDVFYGIDYLILANNGNGFALVDENGNYTPLKK